MDMSLDDIIKKKKLGGKKNVGQNGRQFGRQKNGAVRQTKGVAAKNGKVNDARLKIVQNQRKKLKDARDKLVAINKLKGDARQKIEKLRTKKLQQKPISGPGRISVQRSPDGRLRLTTQSKLRAPSTKIAQPKHRSSGPLRLSHPIYKESEPRIDEIVADYRPLAYSGAMLQRTIPNRSLDYGYTVSERSRQGHLWTRPSTANQSMYRSSNAIPEDAKPIPAIVTRRSEMSSWSRGYQDSSTSVTQRSDPYTSRLRMDQEANRSVHARLDRPSGYQQSQLPPSPSEEDGYRIIVSNLHHSVTSVDIKELFEDVGELIVWRVVRPGTGEVVYKRHDQAVKAVEVYHNRLLDGLPMKCMLVNPLKTSNGRSQKIMPTAGGIKPTVRPELDAVQDALFGHYRVNLDEPLSKRLKF